MAASVVRPAARGPALGRQPGRCARAPRAASLASRRAVRALRRVPVVAWCAACCARQASPGLALGVDGGEHQAAEHAEVLEEVDALLGPPRRRPPPPRTGGRPGWSAPGCRRAGPTRAAGTARSRAAARPPTCTAPLILHQLSRCPRAGRAASRRSAVRSGRRPATLLAGVRSASRPPMTNIEARQGRARRRTRVMVRPCPRVPATNPRHRGVGGSGRLGRVCGRYAASANPDDLVEEFEVVERPEQALEPSWNVAPTAGRLRRARAGAAGRARRAAAAPAAGGAVGAGAVLGEGRLDRQPHDQRPDGDRGREAGVQEGVRQAPGAAARRRLLRVVRRGEGQEAAVLHPAAPTAACWRWPGSTSCGATRRCRGRRRRPVAVDGDRAHDHGHRRPRPDPRPDAAAGREAAVRRVAGPCGRRPGRAARPAGAGRTGPADGVPRRHDRQQREEQRSRAGRPPPRRARPRPTDEPPPTDQVRLVCLRRPRPS